MKKNATKATTSTSQGKKERGFSLNSLDSFRPYNPTNLAKRKPKVERVSRKRFGKQRLWVVVVYGRKALRRP